MPPLLEVQGLCFRYPAYPGLDSRRLFEGLDLGVEPGEGVRVLGAPELGKSTLARILCGLVPRYTGGEVSGAIRVAGRNVLAERPCDLIESVGVVFQNPDEQILATRCSSEVAFALESLGMDRAEMRRRVEAALEWAGLAEHARRVPVTLSGGEKRRLLLACLHALRPSLWLLDETVEELDVAFRDSLAAYLRETGAARVLFASRELALPEGCVGRTLCLEQGRLRRMPAAQERPPRPALPRGTGARAPGEPVLEARGLGYAFPAAGDVAPAGGGFRLEVPELVLREGEVVALAGPNGAGKSTLGRILCGLLRPARGAVRIRRSGTMVEADGDLLRSTVAYVFQNPDYQVFLPTVHEELSYGLAETKEQAGSREQRIAEAARRFNLPPPEAPVALLSYGARKRLQLATYFLLTRPIVILDEADSGLAGEEYVAALRAFADRGSAVIAISHDHELAALVAHRVLTMEKGVLAC